ncbi:MAG: PQQ-dependent sugar dehydrogenase, partial [Deltaproteobacteria bacterium]|nr:PQQ-dependent sugar dehydrogenase [Deltaproteobacteria bacterium]
ADSKVIFASDLNKPHGIAFIGAEAIVAETGGLVLLKDTDNDLKADVRKVISRDLPEGGGHWTRTVAAGSDGYLYVSAGSSCNACEEKDPRRAAVLRFKPQGGQAEVFAKGLRNSVGIAFEPDTKELWGVDNGADWLGENLPPEELNRIVKGGDYGWPYCYGDNIPDPDMGTTLPPAVKMQAHSAPLGMAFGYNLKFPQPYRDVLFVAFHGSWNRLAPTGYKLIGIPFKNGRPDGEPFDFITGWMRGGVAWGRPVGLLVGGDGALYLSDDYAGAVYRITYGQK